MPVIQRRLGGAVAESSLVRSDGAESADEINGDAESKVLAAGCVAADAERERCARCSSAMTNTSTKLSLPRTNEAASYEV